MSVLVSVSASVYHNYCHCNSPPHRLVTVSQCESVREEREKRREREREGEKSADLAAKLITQHPYINAHIDDE